MSWSPRVGRLLAASVAGAALAIGPAAPAFAHAVLVGTDPPAGSVVAVAPASVTLSFSEELSARFSDASLLDGQGRTVAGTAARVDGQRLVLRLPALSAGTYGVAWRVLAEGDGHRTNGMLVFSVRQASAGSTLTSTVGGTGAGPLDALRHWLFLLALGALAGSLVMVRAVLGPLGARAPTGTQPAAGPPAATLADAGSRLLAVAQLGALGVLVTSAVDAVGRSPDGGGYGALLLDTAWGRLWLVGVAAALAATVATGLLRRLGPRQRGRAAAGGWMLATAGTVGVAVVEGAHSHAGGLAADRLVAIGVASLHALSACAWLGAVVAVLVLLRAGPGAAGAPRGGLLRPVVPHLLRLMLVLAVLAVGTGLYDAGRQVEAVRDTVDTTYGRTLLVKVALVAVMGGLGLVNLWWWRRTRTAGRGGGWRPVAAEAVAGALVLLAAGVLTETAPARGTRPQAQPAATTTATATVDDLVVSLAVSPDRPGVNGFTVDAASTRRPPPAPVTAITVEVSGPGGTATPVTMRRLSDGRFFGSGALPAPGAAPIRVTVTRSAGEPIPVQFAWSVPPAVAVAAPAATASFTDPLAIVLIGSAVALALWWGLFAGRRFRLSAPMPPVVAPPVPPHRREVLEDVP